MLSVRSGRSRRARPRRLARHDAATVLCRALLHEPELLTALDTEGSRVAPTGSSPSSPASQPSHDARPERVGLARNPDSRWHDAPTSPRSTARISGLELRAREDTAGDAASCSRRSSSSISRPTGADEVAAALRSHSSFTALLGVGTWLRRRAAEGFVLAPSTGVLCLPGRDAIGRAPGVRGVLFAGRRADFSGSRSPTSASAPSGRFR